MDDKGFLCGAFLASSPLVSRSVICPEVRALPFKAGPILPWPSGPWQEPHFALYAAAPSAANAGKAIDNVKTMIISRTSSFVMRMRFSFEEFIYVFRILRDNSAF